MVDTDKCELIKSAKDLEKAIKEKDPVFVLFYASWCPYSQRFLPEFLDSSSKATQCHVRILVDDDEALVEKYSIEVYPTVLFFQNGKQVKRLAGIPQKGLNRSQLKDFVETCQIKNKGKNAT